MSAGGAFGGARGNAPKPPEKGVFPLDHLGECKDVSVNSERVKRVCLALVFFRVDRCSTSPPPLQLKEAYTACLRAASADADACVAAARAYLACRMERGLMARQSLDELGVEASGADKASAETRSAARTKAGFVAGIRPSKK
jgi:cytochrome c oxidase assembly protein subunit 19